MKKALLSSPLLWIGIPVLIAILIILRPLMADGSGDDVPVFPRGQMTIVRADGTSFPFDIELATTPQQQAYGLMNRHAMPADSGMLFLWERDQPITMWMKDTFIPLDMLFVDGAGVIIKITANAEPLSLQQLSSGQPVRAVVEINGGEAGRRGFKNGDKVVYPALSGTP